jgi:hypothetical protein
MAAAMSSRRADTGSDGGKLISGTGLALASDLARVEVVIGPSCKIDDYFKAA